MSSVVNQRIAPGLLFDARLALFLEATRSLVVADLHWGYAESHRATGNLFPVWGDNTLEATLRALVADYAPAEMIWLGDSLHTLRARTRAERFLAEAPCPVHVLAGNHDLRWERAAPGPLARGGHLLHHGDRELPANPRREAGSLEIIGHHHPAYLHRDGAGARLKLPALVQAPVRLILPALSPWAAGAAWNERLAPDEILWAATPRRILRIAPPSPPSPPAPPAP